MNNERLMQLEAYIESGSTDPFIRYVLATEYLKEQDEAKALYHFETLLELHPEYMGTYYHLGKLYERLDRREAAIKTYEAGIALAQKIKNLKTLAEIRTALQNLLIDD